MDKPGQPRNPASRAAHNGVGIAQDASRCLGGGIATMISAARQAKASGRARLHHIGNSGRSVTIISSLSGSMTADNGAVQGLKTRCIRSERAFESRSDP